MLLLASYPRSGNTFFRNVLREVYGIESSTFHLENEYPLDPNYDKFSVVKTHLLPSQLPLNLKNAPAIYLVRDGRDCAVSVAWYRKQLIEPSSEYERNLIETIEAAEESHFGGWSEHVRQWQDQAVLTIRFEELIQSPIECVERLRPWLDLPAPRIENLPTFSDMQTQDFKYGSGIDHGFSEEERKRCRAGKFRRGKAGGWRDEMPENFQLAFYARHGVQLKELGYWQPDSQTTDNNSPRQLPIDSSTHAEQQITSSLQPPRKKRVLIDASKLMGNHEDGIGRYVKELLAALLETTSNDNSWHFDISLGPIGVLSLEKCREEILNKVPPISANKNFLHWDRMQARIRHASQRLKEGKENLRARTSRSIRLFFLKLAFSAFKRTLKIRKLISGQSEIYDIIHLTLPNNYELSKRYSGHLVTTVHDLSHKVCPELQALSNVHTLQMGLDHVERRQSHYLAVSEATRQAMIDELDIEGSRISTIPNSVSHDWCKPVIEPVTLKNVRESHSLPPGPYFLSVGTIEPRKNINMLIDAFNQLVTKYPELDVNLALAGAAGWEKMPAIERKVMNSERIHYIGFVDDNDLPTLYSSAIATCYISKYEGFGLPILESMTCGTPAIYGNNSSMPEVAGNSGIAVDVDDVNDVTRGLYQLASDPDLRHQLAQRAIDQTLQATWAKVAELTLQCYENVIDQKSPIVSEPANIIAFTPPSNQEGEKRVA